MTQIDIDKIGAHAGPKVILAQSVIVNGAGSGVALAGFAGLDGVYVEVTVDLRDRHKGEPSLTVSLDQSTDGESFASAHDFDFVAQGVLAFTLESPDDQLRVSWDVGGGSEWNIRQVLVAPISINEGAAAAGATDEVITMTHGGAVPALLPILALDLDAQTVTVAGDQTDIADLMILVPNAVSFVIAGSTGNDGFYVVTSASYDSGTNRTTITLDTVDGGTLTDPTIDGTVQWGIVYLAEIAIPPNGAVEWVLIDTTVQWSGAFYGVIGDDDDPEGFCSRIGAGPVGGVDVQDVGRWQWPTNTLNAASSSPIVLVGNYPGIKQYPAGGTVRVIWVEFASGSAGSTLIVVHHHFTEPVAPTRIPAA